MITDSVLDIKNKIGQKLTDVRSKWNSFSVNKEQRANLILQRKEIEEKLRLEKDANKRAEHLENLKEVQEKHKLAMEDSFHRTMLRSAGAGVGFFAKHSILLTMIIIVTIILAPVTIVPIYGMYATGQLDNVIGEKFSDSQIWWDESNPLNIYSAFLEKQKKLAMGDYYSGVEEDSSKQLGLFIESFEPIQKEFDSLADPEIYLFATVTGEALDYEHDQEVTFSCEIEKGAKGETYPSSISFIDLTGGRETVDCTIKNKGLKEGQNIVKFKSTFPFTQKSYLLASFIDRDRRNEYIKQNAAFLDSIEKKPAAVHSAGPANIGIGLGQDMPISVNSDCTGKELGCTLSLGITIDDAIWQTTGKFNQINNITVALPQGMVMQKVLDAISCQTPKGTIEMEEMPGNIYVAKDTTRLKDINEPSTIRCRVKLNHGEILGNSPLTPQGIQVEIAYVYEVFKSTNINIKNGISEELSKFAGKNAGIIYESFGPQIEAAQKTYDIPVEMILATISHESSGNQFAVYCAEGSIGLTALMPATAQEMGLTTIYNSEKIGKISNAEYGAALCEAIKGKTNEEKIALDDRFDAAKNIDAGTKYLKQQLTYCRGKLITEEKELHLCIYTAYNSGAVNVGKAITKAGSNSFNDYGTYLPKSDTFNAEAYALESLSREQLAEVAIS